jgi:hypothetical protein
MKPHFLIGGSVHLSVTGAIIIAALMLFLLIFMKVEDNYKEWIRKVKGWFKKAGD